MPVAFATWHTNELLLVLVDNFYRAAVIEPVSSLLMRARDYPYDTDYNKQVLAIALSIVIANPYTPKAMCNSIAEHLAGLHDKANIQDAAAPDYITEWLPVALKRRRRERTKQLGNQALEREAERLCAAQVKTSVRYEQRLVRVLMLLLAFSFFSFPNSTSVISPQ